MGKCARVKAYNYLLSFLIFFILFLEKIMKINRYFESHHEPNDTMFVEIDNRYRFTGRGTDWGKFRDHLLTVIKDTISDEVAEEFERNTEDWVSASA